MASLFMAFKGFDMWLEKHPEKFFKCISVQTLILKYISVLDQSS